MSEILIVTVFTLTLVDAMSNFRRHVSSTDPVIPKKYLKELQDTRANGGQYPS